MLDSENIDMYAVLQVHPTAEPEIVDAAYRRLARMYHPDVNKSPGAHETMIRINLAYEILGDPAKRAAYDRDRANRQQTEWQAWTERAERERRERAERAEREQRERQTRAEREQRERSEQAERERRARAEQERAEREQRERQAQANPTHQSYAEWEADMQRQVRANAERQRAERERQRWGRKESHYTEQKPSTLVSFIAGILLSVIYCIVSVIIFVPLNLIGWGVAGGIIIGIIDFTLLFIALSAIFFGGISARNPHPQLGIRFVRAFLATLLLLPSLFAILFVILRVAGLAIEAVASANIFVAVSSFILAAICNVVASLFNED